MKVVIVEDEPLSVGLLSSLIVKEIAGAQIVGVCDSVESAVFWFKNNSSPDLVFMDIQLADGVSFEIFKEISITSPIIFTTAYEEFTLQAFRVNSIAYLLKPISADDFREAVNKFHSIQLSTRQEIAYQVNQLIQSGELQRISYRNRFLLRKGERLIPVEENSISYFMSEDKTTLCVSTDAQQYMMDVTLDALSGQVNPDLFFRVNRKYLITRGSLEDIRLHLNGKLKLTLKACKDSDIYVSRERAAEFRKWLGA
jgi:DNA-binding LytR/AlgR family response regulator